MFNPYCKEKHVPVTKKNQQAMIKPTQTKQILSLGRAKRHRHSFAQSSQYAHLQQLAVSLKHGLSKIATTSLQRKEIKSRTSCDPTLTINKNIELESKTKSVILVERKLIGVVWRAGMLEFNSARRRRTLAGSSTVSEKKKKLKIKLWCSN